MSWLILRRLLLCDGPVSGLWETGGSFIKIMGIDLTPRAIDLAQIITITTPRRRETQRRGL